jgi:hypothetical protein
VPGLNRVSAAVVVEMQLAPGVPYRSLPSPLPAPHDGGPPLPALMLSVTAEAISLLLESDQDGSGCLAQGLEDNGSGRSIVTMMQSLLHVCVSAAAGRVDALPVARGWWPPCALHVRFDECDEWVGCSSSKMTSAWDAAVAVMQQAASQWPLAKVCPLPNAARPNRRHNSVCSCPSKVTAVPAMT